MRSAVRLNASYGEKKEALLATLVCGCNLDNLVQDANSLGPIVL